jgi:putative SOS response-associated peptidase YedK
MCGRFVRKSSLTEITDEFSIDEIQWAWEPSYNIAPGQDIAVVIRNGKNQLVACRWGLIPWWAKDETIGYKMINARAETLAEKRSFAKPFRSQRCLIIADGFYEWQKHEQDARKTPIYVRLRSGRPFGFAGIYDRWKSKDDKRIMSCTIITTEPNSLLKSIHNRMPVIIEPDSRDIWLDKDMQDIDRLTALLKPYETGSMEAYEVSSLVNSPKNNRPDLINPVSMFEGGK